MQLLGRESFQFSSTVVVRAAGTNEEKIPATRVILATVTLIFSQPRARFHRRTKIEERQKLTENLVDQFDLQVAGTQREEQGPSPYHPTHWGRNDDPNLFLIV